MDDPYYLASGVREGEILADKYRVERVLGVGGMGVVVAAHHLQLDEKVALKFLLPALLANKEAVSRFAREARAAVKIKSEHVARVSDVGTLENGAPYMVMEYLEGSDLSMWLGQRGALPIEQAAEFILQASEAIAEAHALGIVHRDLKPANLFVIRRPDSTLSVKVLDFGISKSTGLGGSGAGSSVTQTSALMGSPLYMSPEQMQSSKDVDTRSDIWSLGVILYQLVANAPPFHADTMPELVLTIVSRGPDPLRAHRADVPEGFETVILRCLDKDRGKRFQTVGELAIALLPFGPKRAKASVERISGILRAAGFSESTLALPPSSDQRSDVVPETGTAASWGRTTAKKNPRGVTLLAGLGVLALAGGGLGYWRTHVAPAAPAASVATTGTATPSTATVASDPIAVPSTATVGSPLAANASASAPEPLVSAVRTDAPPANAPPVADQPRACTGGAARCSGALIQRCSTEGHWQAGVSCPAAERCRDGRCESPPSSAVTPASVSVTHPQNQAATQPNPNPTTPPAPAHPSDIFKDRN